MGSFRKLSLLTGFVGIIMVPAICLGRHQAWRQRLAGTGYSIGLNPYNPSTVYAQGLDGGLYITRNAGQSWTLQSNPGIPDIREIIVHPNDTLTVFVVGFSSGLLRSTDGGSTWSIVIQPFGIDGESIGLDPVHPDTMYAGNYGDGTIHRSTDRGATWTITGQVTGWICSIAVRPDSSDVLYAGTGAGQISKSTDRGATWRAVKAGGGADETPRIVINPLHPRTAYATAFEGTASVNGIWKTTDGGENWSLEALQGIAVWSLDIDPTNPSTLYTGSFTSTVTTVYRSTDSGISWISLDHGLPPGTDMWNIKVHRLQPDSPWVALAAGFSSPSGVFRLTSAQAEIAGAVLDSSTSDTIMNGSLRLSSTGDSVDLAGSRGTFFFDYFPGDPTLTPTIHAQAYPFYIRDIPATFIPDSTTPFDVRLRELPTATIEGTVRDSATGLPLMARAEVTFSTPLGLQVSSDSTDISGAFHLTGLPITYAPFVQYQTIVVTPAFPYAESYFAPLTLDSAGLSLSATLSRADVLVEADADNARYSGYFRSALDSLRLTSRVWNVAESGPPPFSRATEVRKKIIIVYGGSRTTGAPAAELDSLMSCLASGCSLLLTGQNSVNGNDSVPLFSTYFEVRHSGILPLATVTGKTGDLFDGLTFTTGGGTGANDQTEREVLQSTGSSGKPLLVYGPAPTGSSIAGVRRDSSTPGGGKGILFGFGFEAISSASAQAETMRRVIGYFDGTIVLGVPLPQSGNAPVAFALEQNYPNPFNPATQVRYQLPATSAVSLKVYDVLGREAAVLVNRTQSSGAYTVTWDASAFASGMYFLRLEARSVEGRGLFVGVKRAVLVK